MPEGREQYVIGADDGTPWGSVQLAHDWAVAA